jgi:hypothetical protein
LSKINLNNFLVFLKTSERHNFKTLARKKPFSFSLLKNGISYIPKSTQKPRNHPLKFLERVIARYNKTGSLVTTDYNNFTVNASYTLSLINEYNKRKDWNRKRFVISMGGKHKIRTVSGHSRH